MLCHEDVLCCVTRMCYAMSRGYAMLCQAGSWRCMHTYLERGYLQQQVPGLGVLGVHAQTQSGGVTGHSRDHLMMRRGGGRKGGREGGREGGGGGIGLE